VRTKLRLYTAVLAIVALGVLVSSTAVATSNGEDKRTLRLVATYSQTEQLDLGTTGLSLGDQFVYSETLTRGGQEIGDSGGVCTVTHVTPPGDIFKNHCIATLSLQHGQITGQGLVEAGGPNATDPFTVAITGGTGAYRGASGEVIIRYVSETRNIFELHLDSSKKKDHQHR
jgi:hypothetical protein